MKSELYHLGNIPVTARQLASLYPRIQAPLQKIGLLVRDRRVIRLKRGLYVASADECEKALSTELIANHIYAPSYVSMHSAL